MRHHHLFTVPAFFLVSTAGFAQFAPPDTVSYAWCGQASTVRTADVDGDGDPDLVTAARSNGWMRWLENDGTARFPTPHVLNADLPGVSDMWIEDLDGDGDPDMVASSNTGNAVVWAPGNGDGTFASYVTIAPFFQGAGRMRLADLDSDGDTDILVASSALDSAAWIPNNGSGTFLPIQGICGQLDGLSDIGVGDLDGDGDQDVATASVGDDKVVWHANDGNEQFTVAQVIDQDMAGAHLCDIVDMDGDGDLDVVAASSMADGIRWYPNDGAGMFSGAPGMNTDTIIRAFRFADVSGDGITDAVYVGNLFLAGSTMNVKLGLGGGTFGPQVNVLTINNCYFDVELGDLDGDGDTDILYSADQSYEAGWFPNEGAGTFEGRWAVAPPVALPLCVAAADIDDDGDDDLVFGTNADGKVSWARNDGTGAFSTPETITRDLFSVEQVCTGDLDDDGDPDVLSVSFYDSTLAWYENLDGLGEFGPMQVISTHAYRSYSAAIGDVDGDGDLDAVATHRNNNELFYVPNNGDGTFGPHQTISLGLNSPRQVAVGDIDGDGDTDIVSSSANDDEISWFANNGGGAFSPHQVSTAVNGAYQLQLGDVDGSGSLDIVCSASIGLGISWFPNDGTGSFGGAIPVTTTAIGMIDLADLDSDGDLDVAVQHAAQSDLLWCPNLGGGTFGATVLIDGSANSGDWVVASDLDLDGDADLVNVCDASHQVRMYENHSGNPRIQGRLFHDANGSGAYDVGEAPMPFIGVQSSPYFSTPYTDPEGIYTFYLSEGVFTVSPLIDEVMWSLSTPFASYEVTLLEGSPPDTGNDFGFVASSEEIDSLIVSLSPMPAGCSGIRNQWITYRNMGNTLPDGYLTLQLDPLISYLAADPAPDSIVNDMIYWNYADPAFFAENSIHLNLSNPDASHVGETVTNTLAVHIVDNGSITATYTDLKSRTVTCAVDPNDKLVDPVGFGDLGVVEVDIPYFQYTVRFQNTGNAPAERVVVRDALDPSLDWSSVTLVGSSHALTDMRIEVDGELVFTFDGINLPDSVSDEPGSHGVITFRASPLPGTASGTTITNTADIYFDLNAPVITNAVSNLLIDCGLYSATVDLIDADLLQASEGVGYQWYQDGLAVPGATTQQLVVEATGYYSVEVTNEYGCVLLSDELLVVIESVDGIAPMHVAVMPNPMSESARVIFSTSLSSDARIELLDLNGRVVRTVKGNGSRELMIERGHLESGMYFLQVMHDGRRMGSMHMVIN